MGPYSDGRGPNRLGRDGTHRDGDNARACTVAVAASAPWVAMPACPLVLVPITRHNRHLP